MPGKANPHFSSYNYFAALFNNSVENNVILMDNKGNIIAINDAFTKCFGYEPKDLIGQNMCVLFTEEDKKKGKPEEEVRKVLSYRQASDDNDLVAKDKTVTWVKGESVLVTNDEGDERILKVIQDIHKQKTSEISRQQLHDFNESILRSIDDMVIVLDDKMNILKANKSFSAVFDTDPVVQAIDFGVLIKPFDPLGELYDKIQNTIQGGKGFSNVSFEMHANSEKNIFDVNCGPMHHTDGENNVLIVIHNITAHKQLEREREDVMGFVAHEIRNPLANLVLCNELIVEAIKENDGDLINDLLNRSKNNIARLNKMIAELYDATKVDSGNLQLDISTFDFNEMIKEAIDTVNGLRPAYNILLRGDANITVSGDRHRLIQVVTNYLSNGIKYSRTNTDVILTTGHDETMITVSVKDEGVGITEKQLPFIFERFFRAEKTRDIEGIGLGLYLCRRIILAHRGRVWAESEEGKGSVFYFTVPIHYNPG